MYGKINVTFSGSVERTSLSTARHGGTVLHSAGGMGRGGPRTPMDIRGVVRKRLLNNQRNESNMEDSGKCSLKNDNNDKINE